MKTKYKSENSMEGILKKEYNNFDNFTDEVFKVNPKANWHYISVLIRCVNFKGKKYHPSAVLKNPYLLFDKKIGERLPI